jgi:hypothetical protein
VGVGLGHGKTYAGRVKRQVGARASAYLQHLTPGLSGRLPPIGRQTSLHAGVEQIVPGGEETLAETHETLRDTTALALSCDMRPFQQEPGALSTENGPAGRPRSRLGVGRLLNLDAAGFSSLLVL